MVTSERPGFQQQVRLAQDCLRGAPGAVGEGTGAAGPAAPAGSQSETRAPNAHCGRRRCAVLAGLARSKARGPGRRSPAERSPWGGPSVHGCAETGVRGVLGSRANRAPGGRAEAPDPGPCGMGMKHAVTEVPRKRECVTHRSFHLPRASPASSVLAKAQGVLAYALALALARGNGATSRWSSGLHPGHSRGHSWFQGLR